jgi:type I restriction enzyme M protein
LNKNKKARDIEINGEVKNYRNREDEVLFMDLRTWGEEYEKKYIRLTDEERDRVTENYHNWQQENYKETYKDIPEFCYSAHVDEIAKNDFSLVPSRYIEFMDKDAEIDFDKEMQTIKSDIETILSEEKKSQDQLKNAFKELGYSLDV